EKMNILKASYTSPRTGERYAYEGTWSRMHLEVRWQVRVFCGNRESGRPHGTIMPCTHGTEEAEVRQCVEAFIEDAEQQGQANSPLN
ncbi:MAG TPA: hypothetical protein VF460_12145, partial [Burkholderiales bacterium]